MATILHEPLAVPPATDGVGGESQPSCGIVCLNAGWGGEGLVESALRWTARTGRTLTVVYVITRDRPRRRDVRAAERAVLHARARAEATGIPLRELIVLAPDVVDGLGMAVEATGGEVLVWEGAATRGPELSLAGTPYREIPWVPRP